MSKIELAFQRGKAFIGFVTAGDPSLEKSLEFILEMEKSGADLIEIGVPFSDPIAEGPVIQAANLRALDAGTTLEDSFRLVELVRNKTNLPLVFLTYLNPVFRYGYEAFCAKSRVIGLDGLIIPDLPFEEQAVLRRVADAHGIDLISLVTPASGDRVKIIAQQAKGFLYLVSSMGVTGIRREIQAELSNIINKIREVSSIPVAVGFGIHSPEQARNVARVADGVIVGSAIVNLIAEHGENSSSALREYVKMMKSALSTLEN